MEKGYHKTGERELFYLRSIGKKGLAKSVYDRFCKEYKEALNEQFPTPLYDLLANIH